MKYLFKIFTNRPLIDMRLSILLEGKKNQTLSVIRIILLFALKIISYTISYSKGLLNIDGTLKLNIH